MTVINLSLGISVAFSPIHLPKASRDEKPDQETFSIQRRTSCQIGGYLVEHKRRLPRTPFLRFQC